MRIPPNRGVAVSGPAFRRRPFSWWSRSCLSMAPDPLVSFDGCVWSVLAIKLVALPRFTFHAVAFDALPIRIFHVLITLDLVHVSPFRTR